MGSVIEAPQAHVEEEAPQASGFAFSVVNRQAIPPDYPERRRGQPWCRTPVPPTPPRVVRSSRALHVLVLPAGLAGRQPGHREGPSRSTARPEQGAAAPMGRGILPDIRRPTIAKTIAAHNVDNTVAHAATSVMDFVAALAAIKEFNVVGAMQGVACQRSPSVKRLVLRSTAMAYGASGDPAFFSEGDHAVREPSNGYGRDLFRHRGLRTRPRPSPPLISTSPSPVTRRSWARASRPEWAPTCRRPLSRR